MVGSKSYLARRRRCLAGLAASMAVLRWRPVAVSWLTNGSSKQWRDITVHSPWCFVLLSLLLLSSVFPFCIPLFISLSNPSLFQPIFFPLLSLFHLLSFSFSSSHPPPLLLALSGIYRAKGSEGVRIAALSCAWGAGPSCPATVPG